MPASAEFSIRLLHGIQGGFAPPEPKAIHTIDKSNASTNLFISSAVRPDGETSLVNSQPKSIDSSHKDTSDLLDELHSILKSIPTESPPQSEDIYGMDTSIAWLSEDLQWENRAPDGCAQGVSEVKPTDDHKVKFKRAVDIVKQLTDKD